MIYTKEQTKHIRFPLGGIGTGCIGLSGDGELCDFEIFNRPAKNTRNGFSHFAIKATSGTKSVVKILHGDTNRDLMGHPWRGDWFCGYGFGPWDIALAGFPHFRNLCFEGAFPLAHLTFSDEDFPATVRLLVFNPMIPHDEWSSSLPAAFFEWEIENTSEGTVDFSLAGTLRNPAESTVNREVSDGEMRGIFFGTDGKTKDELGYSDMCLLTDGDDVDVQEYWYRGNLIQKDAVTTYWKDLSGRPRMPKRHYPDAAKEDHGTIVSHVTLGAGERARLRFLIAWSVPVCYNYWDAGEEGKRPENTWKNYYATQFADSFATARYALAHFDTLKEKSVAFARALSGSTLPDAVREAVRCNLSVLKSPTVCRLEDGSFWAWEGCLETFGSCAGTCQHVWNYAYALPYLFPRLERSIRENTMKYGLMESGATSFRLNLPLKKEMYSCRPCVDGQMGEVIKCYREWKLSGDTEWLRAHAEEIFSMLEYAWSEENPDRWDADRDGVIDGRQHNTLDVEFFGPTSWLEGYYLVAICCGAKMAHALGQTEREALYTDLYRRGKKWVNENLFNGSYFTQKVDLTDKSVLDFYGCTADYWNAESGEIKYQIGESCFIEQMVADWHAALVGVDGVFDKEKKDSALSALYRNNYKRSMRDIVNTWRNFAINDERGTVICTFPEGAKIPAIPVLYAEETMTGFEYALAGLMLREGFVAEGEELVSAVRERFDGVRRNPYNEFECGSNYARSMASFALLPIYSGFTYDMTVGHIGFAPIKGEGSFLFSLADSWGTVTVEKAGATLKVLGNPLTLRSLSLPCANTARRVTVDGKTVDFEVKDGAILFADPVVISEILVAE